MPRSYDYEDDLEIFPGGYGSMTKAPPTFRINYDVSPGQRQTWTDPGYAPEVTVNRVTILVNGEPVECPPWLQAIVLDAIDDERLMEHAAQLEEVI